LKQAADAGTGVVTSLHVGFSWTETPRGNWKDVNPIIPPEDGSCEITKNLLWRNLKIDEPNHFIVQGLRFEDIRYWNINYSQGNVHSDGKVVAWMNGMDITVENEVQRTIPFIIDLGQKCKGKIIGINGALSNLPPIVVANTLIHSFGINNTTYK